MTPIYYRNTANGECFKVTISEGNTMKQIDSLLDAISFKDRAFITEAEFNEYAPKTMDIDIMDAKESCLIGVLTCKFMSMEEFIQLEDVYHNSKNQTNESKSNN